MTFTKIFEKFSDMGKLSDDQLKKGQKLSTSDEFKLVTGDVFYKIITKLRQNDIAKKDQAKGLETLSVYTKLEYNKMKCYIGPNNSSGYCLKDKSELVSVFSTQGSSGSSIVQSSIRNGAKHLDCYAFLKDGKVSGALYSLYHRNGFKIDKSLNTGKIGEPYTIQNGISRYVDDNGKVQIDNPTVVVFMKI